MTRLAIRLILQVDKSLIASDIATGFPYLLALKRQELDGLVQQTFKTYMADQAQVPALGQVMQELPVIVKEALNSYLCGQPLIHLDAIEFDFSWII